MKNAIQNLVLIKSLVFFFLFANVTYSSAQLPDPALIGYFHNWQDPNAPYISLTQVDSRYNVIDVSYNRQEIENAIKSNCKGRKNGSNLYGNGNAGEQIAKICSTVELTNVKTLNY